MNHRHRHRSWMHALLMLAALMQLCAPLLHAQAMAAAPAGLVDAAFCGDKLRGQRLELSSQLPAEVRAAITRSLPDSASASACDDCVCASPAALPVTAAGFAPMVRTQQPIPDHGLPQAAAPDSPLLPPSTGPPVIALTCAVHGGPSAADFPDL